MRGWTRREGEAEKRTRSPLLSPALPKTDKSGRITHNYDYPEYACVRFAKELQPSKRALRGLPRITVVIGETNCLTGRRSSC